MSVQPTTFKSKMAHNIINRSLDEVPVYSQTLRDENDHSSSSEQAIQTTIGSSSHQLGTTSSEPDKGSCSPTLSEMGALEESFLELEIQSSSPEETTRPKATSQSALSVISGQTSTDHSSTFTLGRSISTNSPELHKSGLINDCLKTIWRKSSSSSSSMATRS